MEKKSKYSRERLTPILRDAGQLIWKSRRRLMLGFPLVLLNRVASIVLPGTTKFLIDDVIGKQRYDMLTRLALVVAGASLLEAVTSYALSQTLGQAAQRSISDLRMKIQQHLQRLPIRYFDATKTGTLLSRVMNDAEGIRNLVGTGLVQLTTGTITATIAFAILFYLSPRLTMFLAGALLLFGGILFWAFRTLRPLFRERGKLTANVMGRLSESLSGIRVVKAYRAERREARIFAEGIHTVLRNVLSTMRITSAVGALSSLLIGVVSVIIMVVGGKEVIAGRMTIGSLISFMLYLGVLVAPVIMIVSIGTQLSEAFAGLERMREVLGEQREDHEDAGRQNLGRIDGRITFENVEFEYAAGVPVLKGVSFIAPAGTTTALVGPSGSGKSTLISLIADFYKPARGQILIDGIDLAGIKVDDYRKNIGIVAQDSFLFAGTILENIALGNQRATEEELHRAAVIAHVDEFAMKFPDKYQTVVGERGVKLSGGQKQRVTIARAIIADPRILILDEATSSLDSESEALIQDGLAQLMRGRTTFVIAHRLSTIRRSDQILVLEGGLIVERGTHQELLAQGGRYRTLYEKQYGFETNLFINPGEEVSDFVSEPEAEKVPAAEG